MHTIVETAAYLRAAADAGMTVEEMAAVVDIVAAAPAAGVELVGTGGCRKVRVAGKGRGKSGGYRVVTFFTGPQLPIFLLTVFSKGDRANLSQAERNALARLTATLAATYRKP